MNNLIAISAEHTFLYGCPECSYRFVGMVARPGRNWTGHFQCGECGFGFLVLWGGNKISGIPNPDKTFSRLQRHPREGKLARDTWSRRPFQPYSSSVDGNVIRRGNGPCVICGKRSNLAFDAAVRPGDERDILRMFSEAGIQHCAEGLAFPKTLPTWAAILTVNACADHEKFLVALVRRSGGIGVISTEMIELALAEMGKVAVV